MSKPKEGEGREEEGRVLITNLREKTVSDLSCLSVVSG